MVKITLSPEQKRDIAIIKKKNKIYNSYKELFLNDYKNPLLKCIKTKFTYFKECFSLFDIYTTRFNSHTYLQNYRYKQNTDFNGSIYGTTLRLPSEVHYDKYIFIIDMNNTTNKIMGIGFIKNIIAKDQKIDIYDNQTFNNYIYKSNYYLPLINIHNNDYYEYIKKEWQDFIFNEFESVLFYGKSNLKRGGSYTRFPMKNIKSIHIKFLLTLFILVNPNNFNNKILKKIFIKINY